MRTLVSFTLHRNLARQHAWNTTFGLFAAACLFRLTGWFHIHLFYSLHDLRFLKYLPFLHLLRSPKHSCLCPCPAASTYWSSRPSSLIARFLIPATSRGPLYACASRPDGLDQCPPLIEQVHRQLIVCQY